MKNLIFQGYLDNLDGNEWTDENQFPIYQDSWTIYDNTTFIKKMDKSVFLHKGTGIPKNIKKFFDAEKLQKGEKSNIILEYMHQNFEARVECENYHLERVRLFWKSDFSQIISEKFPAQYDAHKNSWKIENKPLLRLKKINNNEYHVEFIDPHRIIQDIDIEEEFPEFCKEGEVHTYYSNRYERDPKNRQKAIEIHGIKCCVCGFDFGKVYGNRGAGYIEIHHVNPLSEIRGEVIVNPKTDLVPVCSNCHRMIHRARQNMLSVEELKKMIAISIDLL